MALENRTILIVEDEEDGAEVVRWILKHNKAKSATAPSAEAALAQLDQGTFDAILIDLALPEMDGFQLVQHLRTHKPDAPPTIAMTAFHTPELRLKAHNAGFNAYLPKPLDPPQLIKTLESLLSTTPS